MDIRNQFTQRAPALYLLPGLIAGLLLARITPVGALAWGIALVLAALSLWLAKRGKQGLWMVAFTASALLGFWFYGSVRLPMTPEPETLRAPPREAVVMMHIQRIMQAENKFGSATGVARVIKASETSEVRAGDLIYFRLSRRDISQLTIMRGQTLEVTGVLHPIPADVPADSFEAYLKETGVHYRLQQSRQVELIEAAPAFKRLCHSANLKFQQHLRLGEPEGLGLSQIYIAMLLGQKAELSPEQKDRFRTTGTMHLFAISGLHIGVIATVIWQVLLLCRLPAKFTPLLGLPILYFYVEVTGATPSAIRAFLMVAFFWASISVQRQRSPMAALAASAVFVLIIQPTQLWQMGFQLSYLVVISILMFGLPLRERLWALIQPYKYLPEGSWSRRQRVNYWILDKLVLLFAISFSAWLGSAPLSAGFFGFIAPYAIIVNIFLVNLAALVISTGVISLAVASLGIEGLSVFLNHSSWVGISLMDAIVRLNLFLPGATIECPHFPKSVSYTGLLAYISSILAVERVRSAAIRFSIPVAAIMLCLFIGLAWGQS